MPDTKESSGVEVQLDANLKAWDARQAQPKGKPDLPLILAILFLLFVFIFGMRVYHCRDAGDQARKKPNDLISLTFGSVEVLSS